MSICKSELTGGGAKFIKVGNDSFLAIDGINIAEKMLLDDIRISYNDIYKAKLKISKESSIYLNFTQDPIVFLSVKVIYNSLLKIEEDTFLYWRKPNESNNPIAKLLVLTGNSTNPVSNIELENTNAKYDVTIEVMIATIGLDGVVVANSGCVNC
jgi:hypothetical protein